jgi:hypothetical protein
MPVPNRGKEAAALAKLSVIVNALLTLAPDVGASSDIGRDILDAVKKLSKYVPPGSTSQGVENNAMMSMMRNQQQQQPVQAMMAARGAGAGAQPAAASPPAAA